MHDQGFAPRCLGGAETLGLRSFDVANLQGRESLQGSKDPLWQTGELVVIEGSGKHRFHIVLSLWALQQNQVSLVFEQLARQAGQVVLVQ